MLTSPVAAQFHLHWASETLDSAALKSLPQEWEDAAALGLLWEEVTELLLAQGYLSVALDELILRENDLFIAVSSSERFAYFKLEQLFYDSAAQTLPRQIFSPKDFYGWQAAALEKALNSGHPFAKVKTQITWAKPDTVGLKVMVALGPSIQFGGIKVSGYPLSPKFLNNFLGIRSNSLFSQQKVDDWPEKLQSLGYIKLSAAPQLHFEEGRAAMRLFLDRVPSNELEGILGVASQDEGALLTGEVSLKLHAPFKRGSIWEFYWKRFQPASPVYRFAFSYPYLLGSRFSLEGELQGLKQDSVFFNFSSRWQLLWQASVNHELSIGYVNTKSSLPLAGQLTDLGMGQFKRSGIRLGYRYGEEWALLPSSSKLFLEVAVEANNRTSYEKDAQSGAVVDNNTRALQNRSEIALKWFKPLNHPLSLSLGAKAANIFSSDLFRNESYRLGGYNSFRGFPIGYFYASGYWVNSLDLNVSLSDRNFLFLYAEQGYIQQAFRNFADPLTPLSVGLGVEMKVSAGQLRILYGYGFLAGNGDSGLPMLQAGFTSRF